MRDCTFDIIIWNHPVLMMGLIDGSSAESYWEQRISGYGCSVSVGLLPCSSSSPCLSSQSPPATSCWTGETSKALKEVGLPTSNPYKPIQIHVPLNTTASLIVFNPPAVKRLWGSRDYSVETQEMLQEKIELQDIKIHSVMELLLSRHLRWVVLTVIVNFVVIQLCGINAVSDTCRHFLH